MGVSKLKVRVEKKAKAYHARAPGLSKLPFPTIAIIVGVALVNVIVIITSTVVAATAAAISSKFGSFSRVGGIIGTSVSAAVLIILGIANMYILCRLVKQMRRYLYRSADEDPQLDIQGAGCMFGLLRKLFRLMDR
ncbi:MAG: hypothetical protein Q9181_005276 [Wetmoreana brouardii]